MRNELNIFEIAKESVSSENERVDRGLLERRMSPPDEIAGRGVALVALYRDRDLTCSAAFRAQACPDCHFISEFIAYFIFRQVNHTALCRKILDNLQSCLFILLDY